MTPRAARLGAALERLLRECDWAARAEQDAIRHPRRFTDPRDIEIAALLSACLAYGRVDLFGPQIDLVLVRMGSSPYHFVLDFDVKRDRHVFDGFRYRFNQPRDLVGFCVAARAILVQHGSLGTCFAAGFSPDDVTVGPALDRFVGAFLDADLSAVFPGKRLSRGYRHLFPRPSAGGPCKRLLLFLRWMVRREPPDFGLWTVIPPSALVIPVDTHIEHMARAIGLTRRRSRGWRMAEEITARLRGLDADDPVRFDFALCHKRMSGGCLDHRDSGICAPCGLKTVCLHWRRR